MCNQPFFALYFPVREISRGFSLKVGTVRVPLPLIRNRPENHSHNFGKALGEGLCLLCAPFTSLSYLSLPLYISPSTFLSLSLLLSVFSLSLSLAYLMDVFVLVLKYISKEIYPLDSCLWDISFIIILFSIQDEGHK